MNDAMMHPVLRGQRGRMGERLAELLGGQIRAGLFAARARLPSEAALADAHQVSRCVVREALSSLQGRGLVEKRAGAGTFVMAGRLPVLFGAALEDALQRLEIRLALAVEAAGLAALRRTVGQLRALQSALHAIGADGPLADGADRGYFGFHLALAACAGSAHIAGALAFLDRELLRVGAGTASLAAEAREHEQIYQAIERRDAISARAAMRVHLCNVRERFRAGLC